ncbi:MAG TPA: hypothetical protein VGK34_09585 [Armatimonadota bacterium]
MDRIQAEENIKVIREIMERSARTTVFSGLSGVIAGTLALIGCYLTALAWVSLPSSKENAAYLTIWLTVLALSIVQDRFLAERKARKSGQTTWVPATYQSIKALLPGVFLSFVLSMRALTLGEYDAIPALWTLGYGASLCAAGMFSIRELRIFGVVQLLTGAVGLFLVDIPPFPYWSQHGFDAAGIHIVPSLVAPLASLSLVALSFGIYHIIYGIIMWRKYGC